MAKIPERRQVWLMIANTVGLLFLLPALASIAYLNRSGIAQILSVCELGMIIASIVAWPNVAATKRARALATSALAVYLPATIGWALAMRPAFFEGMPSMHQLWSLAKSAAVVGGISTGLYWGILAIVNFLVLRRPVRAVEHGVAPDDRPKTAARG